MSDDGAIGIAINALPACKDRNRMKATVAKIGQSVTLTEKNRTGLFVAKAGTKPDDALEGTYISSASPGIYWERVCDGITGYPEWYGAISSDGSPGAQLANDAAIAACLSTYPITQLGPRDYWTTKTIKIQRQHSALIGASQNFNDSNGVTRIVCTSDSTPVIQIGPDSYPGSIGAFPQGLRLERICAARSVAPSIASNCAGVLSRWCLNAELRHVKSQTSMRGFEESGTVYLIKEDCHAVRAEMGTGGGTDYFVGHYANGSGSIGAAGGNASLYHHRCNAECNVEALSTAQGSVGFLSDGAFVDCFYRDSETVNFCYGRLISGTGETGISYKNVDFIAENDVHDQFRHCGIYITGVDAGGNVEIENPYLGPNPSARANYWVNSSQGSVTKRGGRHVMPQAPNTQAMLLINSQNADILSFPSVVEHGNGYAVVGWANLKNSTIQVRVVNPNVNAGPVMQSSGTCENLYLEPRCSGGAGKFQYGIQILGTITQSTFDVSKISSSSLVDPTRKLVLETGGTITSAGYISGSDTNLAIGNFK